MTSAQRQEAGHSPNLTKQFATPIAFFVFNRPEHTRASFERIRQQRPRELFIIADGPRPQVPTDRDQCAEVRAAIQCVDWPCEVRRNYADENLGLKQRVSTGLSWVFRAVDRAIILEDDCLPHPDFFGFCEDLLIRYEDDPRVAQITGNNFQRGRKRGSASYYFSKYPHIWGWAAWRRTWELFDLDMGFWRKWSNSPAWDRLHDDPIEREYWHRVLTSAAEGRRNTWGYQWTASVWASGGLTATPNVNLVQNTGFGGEGTHTTGDAGTQSVPTTAVGPIRHPSSVRQHVHADRFVFDYHFEGRTRRLRATRLGQLWWALTGLVRRTARMWGRRKDRA